MPPPRPTSRLALNPVVWPCVALIALATLAVFGPAVMHEFVTWDDHLNVSQNPDLNPVTAQSLTAIWRGPRHFLYIPLTYTAWAALTPLARTSAPDADGATLNPYLYHALNLVIHLISALVVFQILRRLVGRDWPAALGAIAFAIHPLQVESVAWVTGLKDVLSGMLALVAVWQYLESIPTPDGVSSPDVARRRTTAWAVAFLSFIAGLLAKPSAVSALLIAGTIDAFIIRRPIRKVMASLALWLLPTAVILLVNRAAQPAGLVRDMPSIGGRIMVALDALGFYVRKLLLPWNMGFDYGRSPAWLLRDPQAKVAWVIPTALGALAVLLRKRLPIFGGILAVAVAALLPVLGLVPFEFQNFSTVTDHYAYLAMLGPAILLAVFLSQRPTFARFGLTSAWLAVLVGLSIAQVGYWRDSATLLTHGVAVNPRSWTAHETLGDLALRQGDYASAEAHLERATQLRPDLARAHVELAAALLAERKLSWAQEEFQRAAAADAADPEPHFGLAHVYAAQGHWRLARGEYQRGFALRPNDASNQADYQAALAHGD